MTSRFIFQGVTADNHLDEIRDTFQLANIERVIISVAFLNERGFDLLKDILKPVADKTTVFAGIRNGITSGQGLLACIDCGCATYAVDTGSRSVIFHPKIYLAKSATEARIVLGSANLTVGGLHGNIEAGLKIIADMTVERDAALVKDLTTKVDAMVDEFPQHVFQIKDKQQVLDLLKAGRVIDEKKTPPPTPGGSSGNRDLDDIPKIKLKKKSLKLPIVTTLIDEEIAGAKAAGEAVNLQKEAATLLSKLAIKELELVWRSKPLTERPLNIPKSKKTNPTGSMNFSKGLNSDIDQRSYFRHEVFSSLIWAPDPNPNRSHLERANAQFCIVVRNVNYGVYNMQLTHNSNKAMETYKQSNSPTRLHWGKVKSIVAHKDLLNRTVYLYRDKEKPDQFVLEID